MSNGRTRDDSNPGASNPGEKPPDPTTANGPTQPPHVLWAAAAGGLIGGLVGALIGAGIG